MRKYIVEALESDPFLQVVGEAGDGQRAIELCEELRPDVVTMDMMLSAKSGLFATEHIMAHYPTPILIISASTNRRELFNTYDALAAGAVDVLEKPGPEVPDGHWKSELLSKLRMVSRIPVITHVRAKLRSFGEPALPESKRAAREKSRERIQFVAIGTSTGGPAAILEILRHLPPVFDLPILLVLHLAGPFGSAFADWLDEQQSMPVMYVEDGMPLPSPGKAVVLMARPDRHLVLDRGRLRLTADPERHSCRPSVDVLFESIAREMRGGVIACLLTGMGKDGAEGLGAIRRAGGITLAQDKATSVVFGMPGEAIRLGGADRVLPLSRFAAEIASLAGVDGSGVSR